MRAAGWRAPAENAHIIYYTLFINFVECEVPHDQLYMSYIFSGRVALRPNMFLKTQT